jgi:hypothetical protein
MGFVFFFFSVGYSWYKTYFSGVMIRMITSSTLYPQFCQTKDHLIHICWFSPKHTALRSKNKDG